MKIISILLLTLTLLGAKPIVLVEGNGDAYAKNDYAKGRSAHREAAAAISSSIAKDAGKPAGNYSNYSSDLANILGQLDGEALARVLGENIASLP
ncbi:MAG: hypothetical protein P1V20_02810 [Verrucomicrobiales bacterium]|nr:hypothetical protein [Verrucomicrobiales bacterium]